MLVVRGLLQSEGLSGGNTDCMTGLYSLLHLKRSIGSSSAEKTVCTQTTQTVRLVGQRSTAAERGPWSTSAERDPFSFALRKYIQHEWSEVYCIERTVQVI